MNELFAEIIRANRKLVQYETIGLSREGRPILAARCGTGSHRVSLIAGLHADEPIGALLLRYLTSYLQSLPKSHSLLKEYSWWIIPHGNPDGEIINARWFHQTAHEADLGSYLCFRHREQPGDDLEYGFPLSEVDSTARPETQAIWKWWRTDSTPFALHVSLHSMSYAGGAWFLLPQDFPNDLTDLKSTLRQTTAKLGYVLHDVERMGEKGFYRIEPGFCTHPTSESMKSHFLQKQDATTADKFRLSSMEAVKSFGGTPLTLIPEIPFFILPGVGLELGPPDPVAVQWQERLALWQLELIRGSTIDEINIQAEATGVTALPYDHHMQLQWQLIVAGLETIAPHSH